MKSPSRFMSSWIINPLNKSALMRSIFIFLAWLAVWQIGRLVEYTEHASVWFPAAGFTFSCFLVLGYRAFLPIMAAAIVTTIWNGNHYQLPLTTYELIWAGFLFGLAHMIPYWIAANWVARLSRQSIPNAPQLIVTFLLVAGLSALVTTILVVASLVVTNQLAVKDVKDILLPFWVGDMAGVVVLAPMLSGILVRLFTHTNLDISTFTQEGIGSFKNIVNKMGLNFILIFFTMLLAYLTESQESSFAIFFLAVTHMWIATTESPTFNVISLAASSFLIVLLVHFFGLMNHVMVYQFAINVIAANALFGIAIPQLRAYNRKLENMVHTDSLTQVSSRHYMEKRAELEIITSHEQNMPLTLVIFDLDNFKCINDLYGHTTGDTALKHVCKTTLSSLRRNDIIARFGGDEFILLFPQLDIKSVYLIIDKIMYAIQQIKIKKTLLSSSFGIAELCPNEDYNSLFHRADQALFKAKKNGGRKICFANEPD